MAKKTGVASRIGKRSNSRATISRGPEDVEISRNLSPVKSVSESNSALLERDLSGESEKQDQTEG